LRDVNMTFVRRIESAAEEADLHPMLEVQSEAQEFPVRPCSRSLDGSPPGSSQRGTPGPARVNARSSAWISGPAV